MKKRYTAIIASGLLATTLAAGTAFAATTNTQTETGHIGHSSMMRSGIPKPVITGTISAVSGTTLTVLNNKNKTTYTVDASNAKITKNGVSSSVGNIALGDTVMVAGTINGLNVTATDIRDGVAQGQKPKMMQQNPIIKGTGEPVVGGTVSAINGAVLTLTTKSSLTYTVNVASAKIKKGNTDSAISSIAVGDRVVVQGAVNGTSVTASSVIDQGNAINVQTNTAKDDSKTRTGFLGGIGNFFVQLFGF